jgi:hypothetical protein
MSRDDIAKEGINTRFSSTNQPEHNGRPKGSKNYKTRVKELLAGISDDREWTSPLAAEKVKIIFSKDSNGKYIYPVNERQKAIDSLLNRVEGMPVQKTESKVEGDLNIHIGKDID